ncbi:MAG: hypothetical protein M0P39_06780 [Rhodocyclaceae bacterium]|nr:hypothetical protein [Rhodocyclaceae bacterium]
MFRTLFAALFMGLFALNALALTAPGGYRAVSPYTVRWGSTCAQMGAADYSPTQCSYGGNVYTKGNWSYGCSSGTGKPAVGSASALNASVACVPFTCPAGEEETSPYVCTPVACSPGHHYDTATSACVTDKTCEAGQQVGFSVPYTDTMIIGSLCVAGCQADTDTASNQYAVDGTQVWKGLATLTGTTCQQGASGSSSGNTVSVSAVTPTIGIDPPPTPVEQLASVPYECAGATCPGANPPLASVDKGSSEIPVQTVCSGAGCTSTSINADGSAGSTSQSSGAREFCAEHPDAALCAIGAMRITGQCGGPGQPACAVSASALSEPDKATLSGQGQGLITSIALPDHGWSWSPTVPTYTTCEPISATLHGRTVSLDLCPTLDKLRAVFAYVIYILTAFALFHILFRPES